jgi:tRNA-specific 2-thiouridylase
MSIRFDPSRRLLVAMSGGVDSSVAAWLLARLGHPLVGLFMRNGVEVKEEESAKKSCCSVTDARDARMVAAGLGIPFQAVDLGEEFGDVIRYFLAEYGRGRTPNPCAVCNRDLKMGRLIELADELGCSAVATGHYARIELLDGRVHLLRGLDEHKDQSYQLFAVAEEHLARTVLPLGAMHKREVRSLAAEAGLRTSAKKDSQEVCFVPSNDYRQLLRERGVELHPGRILDTLGRDLGRHEGTEHFTIGQRRGHGVASSDPLYVVELMPEEGVVVLGSRAECRVRSMVVQDLNWIGFDPAQESAGGDFECQVQYRHLGSTSRARVQIKADEARVEFIDAPMSVAPGQGAAFYREERLLGGGWIASTERLAGTHPREVDESGIESPLRP